MRTSTPRSDRAERMRSDTIRPSFAGRVWLQQLKFEPFSPTYSLSRYYTTRIGQQSQFKFLSYLWQITVSWFASTLRKTVTALSHAIKKMQNRNDAPFPFMQLPPELRDMVYENLLEDPHYPPPQPCPETRGPSWLSSIAQLPSSAQAKTTCHKSNFLFLANKQIYAEYMDLLCKKTTFYMTIAPHNYAPPETPADEEKDIWQISPNVLKKIKRCDIQLVTTSAMLGMSDPRTMKSEDWALARQMRRQLSGLHPNASLNLAVKAIGDPLWSPLWVWYHTTEALRGMGSPSLQEEDPRNETVVVDDGKGVALSKPTRSEPQFNRITLALDMWSPGENHLARHPANGQWAWWCVKGHCVGQVGAEHPVRQFCSWLYDCPVCSPEEDEV